MPSFATSGWKDGWYVVPWEVTWRDLDAMGHVNNAVFFTLFEWGRTRYWLDLRQSREARDIGFIVARAECDFLRQLGLGDRIEIATRVGEMRSTSFDFVSEIRTESGEVSARGRVVVVMFSWERNEKMTIPAELRAAVAGFQRSERV
ncbi:MAG TPA: thioesterase family protein [Thermoanaerobaculia bacterium]|nr:thioesterase family protein [Thermoanaerobaculia bacterium]